MEMWLKSAIIALLTVLGATLVMTSENRLNLKNTNNTEQREKRVSPGSSLELHCCLSGQTFERCRVTWHFRPSGENKTELVKNNDGICNWTKATTCNLSNMCDNIPCSLSIANESKSGWYYCTVTGEIPVLKVLESNEIKVIVENLKEKSTVQSQTTKSQVTSQKEENDQNENLLMWIIVGASSFVLVMTALMVACVVRKRGCSRSIEEPVYVNTRLGKPSPRLMPADNPKSVSASQDLRTPISARRYEGRNQRYKY